MEPAQKISPLADLEQKLINANIAYTVDCDPIMSDGDYDMFKHLYIAQHEVLYGKAPERPVSLMGIKTAGDAVVIQHPFPMLSLVNTFSFEETQDKLTSCKTPYPLITEYKMDGSSLELIYNEQGRLIHAVKRGDGIEGEVVTHLVDGIMNVPKQITVDSSFKGKTVVRGEVIITNEDFALVQQDRIEETGKGFANSRNAAAGALSLKDKEEVSRRKIRFYAYSIRSTEGDNYGFGRFNTLRELKSFYEKDFTFVPTISVIENIEHLKSLLAKDAAMVPPPFPIDGLVLKADVVSSYALGNSGEGPRYAFAFKYPEETATTYCTGLRYQVGRTGQITPVLEVEPIFCSGVEITNLTVHNFTKLKGFAPKVGARCVIKRAGEVIPYLVSTSTQGEPFDVITHCPCCDSELTTIGELTYCSNDYRCYGRLQAYFEFMVSRKALNVRDVGAKTIKELIDREYIRFPGDLWRLTKDQWYSLNNTETKKVEKILRNLKIAKIQPVWRVIYAAGIQGVGESTAKLLERVCDGSLEKLAGLSTDELMQVRDIGEETAKAINSFFRSDQSIWLDDLVEVLLLSYSKPKDGILNGKTVVVTGGFSIPRSAIQEKIESLGGKLTSSVSAKTDFALVGENAGAKASKVDTLGITKLELKDLGL